MGWKIFLRQTRQSGMAAHVEMHLGNFSYLLILERSLECIPSARLLPVPTILSPGTIETSPIGFDVLRAMSLTSPFFFHRPFSVTCRETDR